jgi:hypothetical protein
VRSGSGGGVRILGSCSGERRQWRSELVGGAFVGCLHAAFLLLDVRTASTRAFVAYDILEGGSKQFYLRAHFMFLTALAQCSCASYCKAPLLLTDSAAAIPITTTHTHFASAHSRFLLQRAFLQEHAHRALFCSPAVLQRTYASHIVPSASHSTSSLFALCLGTSLTIL